MSFKIEQKDNYYLIQLFDHVDRDLMASSYFALLKETNFNQLTHTLWDFREATVDLSYEDIQNNAEQLVKDHSNKRANTARSAFIVSDPSDRTILQTYITAVSYYPVEFEIFNNKQDGINWLLN